MRTLSKSKLLAYRQCTKRLWLEVHQPELRSDSVATLASFDTGHEIGDIARQLFDPKSKGVLIDPKMEGFEAAFARTTALVQTAQPIFEAGFRASGVLAFADVMLPSKASQGITWRMIEVKSSGSVKDYHRDDVAIQAFVARNAGVKLKKIALAHVDTTWKYPGDENYDGLLVENDLTEEAFARAEEVEEWVAQAQKVVAKKKAPFIATGKQCHEPFECGFLSHCQSSEPQATHPIHWLPRRSAKLVAQIERSGIKELKDVSDDLLNELQIRVKHATLKKKPHFDSAAAAEKLSNYPLPAYFLDFETISHVIPRWKGTRPYQPIPFQFSLHRLSRTGKLENKAFLDLSGRDPSRNFAEALIDACGERGPIFVYNAGFEKGRSSELADRYPHLSSKLRALIDRMVDLLPIARDYYYHPSQQGSWSIKAVLPTVCPDLKYNDLDGVQDGGMAMTAFHEATSPTTTAERKAEIERQLKKYCELDTYAMVRLWAFFSGASFKV